MLRLSLNELHLESRNGQDKLRIREIYLNATAAGCHYLPCGPRRKAAA